MKPLYSLVLLDSFSRFTHRPTQPSPFLKNTTQTGSYYMQGNSTAIGNGLLVNCQQVAYTNDYSYILGIPSYPTGPFLDGNPSQAQDQSAIYEIPLNPFRKQEREFPLGGNIGVFINGVSLLIIGTAWLGIPPPMPFVEALVIRPVLAGLGQAWTGTGTPYPQRWRALTAAKAIQPWETTITIRIHRPSNST